MPQDPEKAPREPSGDSIGRPGDWSDSRRSPPGARPGVSVVRKSGEAVTQDLPPSTPVTQDDYQRAPRHDPPPRDRPG